MSSACCNQDHDVGAGPAARRALWIALAINAAMFVVEMTAGLAGGSVGLQADAVDFFGDAVNYGLSIGVMGLALAWRTRVAAVKGAGMGLFGLWVWGGIVYHWLHGTVPSAALMGGVGMLALAANVTCAVVLYRFRGADANMTSVWVCTRNDVLSNVAILVAASAVWVGDSGVPDLIVAALIGGLALYGSLEVFRVVRYEWRSCGLDRPADAEAD